MAQRYQIIRKTEEAIERTTVMSDQELEALLRESQARTDVVWIVVKDRYRGTRGLIWRRGQEQVAWWILDPPSPEILWRKKPRFGKNMD